MDKLLHIGKIDGVLISVNGKDVVDFTEGVKEHKDDDPQLIALVEYHNRKQQVADAYQYLKDTDYVACKLAEGAATREEYEDIILKRQAARDLIRAYEE